MSFVMTYPSRRKMEWELVTLVQTYDESVAALDGQ
jgi:hypothetical protein